MARWCSGYHYCTTSFNKAWTQVLRRFKSCSPRVGDSRWWGSLTMSRLEIRLNAFRRSTIPQKQIIIIINVTDFWSLQLPWRVEIYPWTGCTNPFPHQIGYLHQKSHQLVRLFPIVLACQMKSRMQRIVINLKARYIRSKKRVILLCVPLSPSENLKETRLSWLSTMRPLMGITRDNGKQKPVIIKFYDFTKKGTDILDQKISKYLCKAVNHR